MDSAAISITLRQATHHDREAIDEIWLAASLRAYELLPCSYWWQRQQALWGHHLANCEVWVAEQQGQVCGFMALEEERLVALLVAPQWQRQGVGGCLLDLAKRMRKHLQSQVIFR